MMNVRNKIMCLTATVVVGFTAVSGALAQTPLGSEWTYQGKLKLSSDPLNDTADFEFTLFDADVDGNMIGALVPVNNVNVVDGLFTTLLDFGVNAFNGDKRWLGIAVRSPAGGGEFTTLDPRQALTGVPYAVQTRGIFVDDVGDVGIGTTGPANKLSVAGNADFTGNVGIGTPTPELLLHIFDGDAGVTPIGLLAVERDTSSYINLLAPDSNETGILFGKPTGGNAAGGIIFNNGGTRDGLQFRTNGNATRMVVDSAGNVGIGTTTPATELDVAGTVTATFFVGDGSRLTGISGGDPSYGSSAGSPDDAVFVDDGGNVGIGTTTPSGPLEVDGNTFGASFRVIDTPGTNGQRLVGRWAADDAGPQVRYAGAGAGWIDVGQNAAGDYVVETSDTPRLVVRTDGNVGIGTTTPRVKLEIAATGSNANIILQKDDNTFGANIVFFGSGTQYNFGTPDGDRLRIWSRGSGEVFTIRPNGNIGIRTVVPSAALDVVGTTELNGRVTINGNVQTNGQLAANCVVINGGCDLAEPFEITGDSVEPGMLVSIDPENPGQLRLTRNAYDTMVAGVASGAGGVNVGMTLSQEGLFDKGQPVALVGRVYCWCDASNGPIRPGDLLTSSDTPGHAMSVTDRERAFGTTIGKAMSPLKSGKGLVLVLVNLQ